VPANVVAFNDDVLEQTKFDTTRWVDKVTDYCGADFCGTMSYHFTLVNGDPLPFQHTASMVGDDLVLKVQTTDSADIGTYLVRVNAVWTHIDPSTFPDTKVWDSFSVEIKSTCKSASYCTSSTLKSGAPPLNFIANVGANTLSPSFPDFPDSLTDACTALSTPLDCSGSTYAMECYNFAGCDPGPCPAYTTPTFNYNMLTPF